MSAHTKGPWIFYADLPSTEPNWNIVTTESRMRVLANIHIEPGNAMDLANAHLISSAPDLLEVSKLVIETFASFERYGEVCSFEGSPMIHASTLEELADKARDAIAKATGSEK